jgi:hypothetical protein
MIPWTLIITLAQKAAPEILPEIKRLYAQWKESKTEPTPAEWDGLLGRVVDNNLRQMLEAEAGKIA